MVNPHLGGDVLKHLKGIIHDTHEMRLIGLIEACKIVIEQLERQDNEFAKEFLIRAVADAGKPWTENNESSGTV